MTKSQEINILIRLAPVWLGVRLRANGGRVIGRWPGREMTMQEAFDFVRGEK